MCLQLSQAVRGLQRKRGPALHECSEPGSPRSGSPALPPPFARVSLCSGLPSHPLVSKGLAAHPGFGGSGQLPGVKRHHSWRGAACQASLGGT